MVSHFEAVRVGADAKEARLLKQEATSLQICLQKETAIREMQANQKLEEAKVMEETSNQLIREQLEVNEILVKETVRLKQKVAEAAEAQCLICREAKPSKAFVPAMFVCAHPVGMILQEMVAGNAPTAVGM